MKKDQNLFSIGEVAQAVGVTRRIILNYEDQGLVKPDVKDSATGNRYYTIDTFVKIRTIRIFQNLGLSLGEIRGYFDDSFDLPPLIRRLETLRDELDLHIEKLKERSNTALPEVKCITLPRQTIYRRTCTAPTVAERTVLLRDTALEAMRLYGTDITQRMYLLESPIDRPGEASFCVAVPPESRGPFVETLEPVQAVSLYHHGAYEDLPAVDRQLLAYAEEHGLAPMGTVRHIYLEGPPQHKDKSKFITQAAVPVFPAPLSKQENEARP